MDLVVAGQDDSLIDQLSFKLPSTSETVTLPGWSTVTRRGEDGEYLVYISPEGEPFESPEYAHDAIKEASRNSHEKKHRQYAP